MSGPGFLLTPALADAHATLKRGARFLGSGACAVEGRYRAKVIGNGLRELDRFLNILIGEVAHCSGVALRHDQHNTANKLRSLRAAMALDDADHDRLRAFGRTRECLFHCAGMVGRGDGGGMMLTTGWRDSAGLRRVAVGRELAVSSADIAEACRYYEDVARRLLADTALFLSARTEARRRAAEARTRKRTIELGEGQWFAA